MAFRSQETIFRLQPLPTIPPKGLLMFRTQSWISAVRNRGIRVALGLVIPLWAAVTASLPAHAQTYLETVVHTFAGPDGSLPTGTLVAARNGNLYGTTALGGAYNLGTVFQIEKAGKETVLYSFKGTPDGSNAGNLLQSN